MFFRYVAREASDVEIGSELIYNHGSLSSGKVVQSQGQPGTGVFQHLYLELILQWSVDKVAVGILSKFMVVIGSMGKMIVIELVLLRDFSGFQGVEVRYSVEMFCQ